MPPDPPSGDPTGHPLKAAAVRRDPDGDPPIRPRRFPPPASFKEANRGGGWGAIIPLGRNPIYQDRGSTPPEVHAILFITKRHSLFRQSSTC